MLRITGGTALLGADGLQPADLVTSGGMIGQILPAGAAAGPGFGTDADADAGADPRGKADPSGEATARLDATGLLVMPGIVDLHGDAFERQLQPRPGVDFPAALALGDTEAQLLANGITTAYHGVTLSWEPGLRSVSAWRTLLDALTAGSWTCDMRVHLRWEAFNLGALDTALADIEAGLVHLLAFNDHTPSILRKLQDPVEGAKYSGRAGMKMAAFQALAQGVAAQADDIPAARDRIAAAARAAGLPMASHDDASLDDRDRFRALGARICEFPITEDVARAAVAAGDFVAMGSPNVVRGGSHLGWASAADMAEAKICTVLTSDYYYPAMLQAPFVLADRGRMDLAEAWQLIAGTPARAAGLGDRGMIALGRRADFVLIDPATRRAVATIVGGRIAYATREATARLSVISPGAHRHDLPGSEIPGFGVV